jgi:hypothetical protein
MRLAQVIVEPNFLIWSNEVQLRKTDYANEGEASPLWFQGQNSR